MFLPGDVETAIQALLKLALPAIHVGSIGDLDTDENGELVFDPPAARTFYSSSHYEAHGDSQALTYDDVGHQIDIWCAAENLTSLEAQRTDTLTLVATVLPVLAGARLPLPDGSVSEPVRIQAVQGSLQGKMGAPVRTVYTVSIEVPGIAQFPGTYAAGNEDL
jgi:hypothetical protein